MIELLSVLAILVTGTAAVVLVRAAWSHRGIWSLGIAAVGSVSTFVVSVMAGGLYLWTHYTGDNLPLLGAQTVRAVVLVVCMVPACVFLWAYYAGRFR